MGFSCQLFYLGAFLILGNGSPRTIQPISILSKSNNNNKVTLSPLRSPHILLPLRSLRLL
jgi:hypothetical protein